MELRSGRVTKKIKPLDKEFGNFVGHNSTHKNQMRRGLSRKLLGGKAESQKSTSQTEKLSQNLGGSLSGLDSTDPITELQSCAEIIRNSLKRDREFNKSKRKRKVKPCNDRWKFETSLSSADLVTSNHDDSIIVQGSLESKSQGKSKSITRRIDITPELVNSNHSLPKGEDVGKLSPLIFNSPDLKSWGINSPKPMSSPDTNWDSLSNLSLSNPIIKRVYNPTESTSIMEEIQDFYKDFPELSNKYKILRKIGEGAFSSVYKAIDYANHKELLQKLKSEKIPKGPVMEGRYALMAIENHAIVALKRIYAISSLRRIYNEIRILYTLRGCNNILPLLSVLRHEDQAIVVYGFVFNILYHVPILKNIILTRLPYIEHMNFKEYYLEITVLQLKAYMRCLLMALSYVHTFGILHRDVKPSNYLFNPNSMHGVLVDFGLAQLPNNDNTLVGHKSAKGLTSYEDRKSCGGNEYSHNQVSENTEDAIYSEPCGVFLNDKRPPIRANRAGSRGFRAPEILLRVIDQTPAIDVWSSGVILLCIVSTRFPFFQSSDDIDALIEISSIFGYDRIRKIAAKLKRKFRCNIPSISHKEISLESLSKKLASGRRSEFPDECYNLLTKLLEPYPGDRIATCDALKHPFLAE